MFKNKKDTYKIKNYPSPLLPKDKQHLCFGKSPFSLCVDIEISIDIEIILDIDIYIYIKFQ